MVDVEAVEFAIGRKIHTRLSLEVEDDARGVNPGLLARSAASQSGTG